MRKILSQKSSKVQTIKWGILGSGKIAYQFAEQLIKLKDARLVGIASRKFANAQKFSQHYSGAKAYENYEALCQDPEIDVIYVATPTHLHLQHCHLVLDANKALLCEKPFTRNYLEALEIIHKAREKHLFCMEAMWMRFNPYIKIAREAIENNKIGRIRTLHAELGYQKDPASLDSAINGRGSSLTFGCYPISLAIYFFGKPKTVSSHLISNLQGGDETGALLLHYLDKVASIFYSEGATLSNEVSIFGQDGCLHIRSPFIDAPSINIVSLNDIFSRSKITWLKKKFDLIFSELQAKITQYKTIYDYRNIGLRLEAEEVNRCLRSGMRESQVMPLEETLWVHEILDSILV